MDKLLLLSLLGPMPTKVELQAKVIESLDCGSYIRHKVEYYSEVNDSIPAYLLIPKNFSGPAPAVYCFHQHAGNFALGKSEVSRISRRS